MLQSLRSRIRIARLSNWRLSWKCSKMKTHSNRKKSGSCYCRKIRVTVCRQVSITILKSIRMIIRKYLSWKRSKTCLEIENVQLRRLLTKPFTKWKKTLYQNSCYNTKFNNGVNWKKKSKISYKQSKTFSKRKNVFKRSEISKRRIWVIHWVNRRVKLIHMWRIRIRMIRSRFNHPKCRKILENSFKISWNVTTILYLKMIIKHCKKCLERSSTL